MAEDNKLPEDLNWEELLGRFKVDGTRKYTNFDPLKFEDPFEYSRSPPYTYPLIIRIESDLLSLFEGFSKDLSTSFFPTRFEPQPYQLYHGTSTQALDRILDSKKLMTAANLHRNGKLVFGELKRRMDRNNSYDPKGSKFLHPDILDKLGIELTDYDREIFGHAFAVFFSNHPPLCLGYTPENPEEKAIIGFNKNALETRGYNLVYCGSDGIKCESDISLDFGLQVLLVPDSMVDMYRQKTEGIYAVSVFPLSDLS